MKVPLRNKTTGEAKFIKIGWSWTCFFFGTLFGIPLFMRGLNIWGGLMAAMTIAHVMLGTMSPESDGDIMMGIVEIGFSIFFGVQANTFTGKLMLETGWEFAEPDSLATRMACQRWRISAPTVSAGAPA